MTALQFFTSPFAVVLATGTFTLCGALGAQIITARANLKAKRLEWAYTRKADAYRDYIMSMGQAFTTKILQNQNGEAGSELLKEDAQACAKAYAQVSLIGSDELCKVLEKKNGFSSTFGEMLALTSANTEKEWERAMSKVDEHFDEIQELMRVDLKRLGGL